MVRNPFPSGRQGLRYKPNDTLKPYGKKYPTVSIFNDVENKFKEVTVHRLVALTFLNKSGYLVRHLDGNTSDANISNLMWGTDLDNSIDMMHHGTCKNQYGKPSFSKEEIKQLRSKFTGRRGEKVKLARELGVNYWTLRDVLNRKSYRWVK